MGTHRVLSGEKQGILNRDKDEPSESGAETLHTAPGTGMKQVRGNIPLDADDLGPQGQWSVAQWTGAHRSHCPPWQMRSRQG